MSSAEYEVAERAKAVGMRLAARDSAHQVEARVNAKMGAINYHSLSPTISQADQLSESSCSLSNTDSDSLMSVAQQQHLARAQVSAPKSPILIKYNYYDHNGARQEQTNHDANYLRHQQQQQQQQVALGKVQRHLSPTFKQNLDQIVRNSQLQIQANKQSKLSGSLASPTSPTSSSSPGSPDFINNNHSTKSSNLSPQSNGEQVGNQQQVQLARRYKLSSYEQRCLRCNTTVYQMDKVGPLKDFTFYHQNCFKCRICGTKLTLKTYFNNQQSSGDLEVYCHRHCPKTEPGRLDNQSVGIRAALNAPKVFDVSGAVGSHPHETYGGPIQDGQPQVDSRALYIQHAVQQTRLQNIYKQSQVDKKISQFINRRLEFLEPKQKMLEMRHREEEDALFKAFELKWRQEESCISEQIREEWQVELGKLLDKYKRQLSSISANHHQQQQQHYTRGLADQLDPRQPGAQHNGREPKAAAATQGAGMMQEPQLNGMALDEGKKKQMIEMERLNLEKTMTIKLDRKKETLKRKLKEFERQATAELVEKQSREMLALISLKLDEYKEEQKRKIGSDLEQFEAMESLADQLGSSLQLVQQVAAANGSKLSPSGKPPAVAHQAAEQTNRRKLEVPAPKPPLISKMELYNSDEPDELFKDIDQLAINVAREDQRTFTDLVHHLTRHCLTDIEKARAIFRWITVKNLNTMQFDQSVKPDTPLGLLRGIKNGSESYHVLFKRLCSYAGLHCVVIKGYSKSAGYQPGIKFEGSRFRNSWNAVYVAGAWRFVQCNWGARHLVSVAVMQDVVELMMKLTPCGRLPTLPPIDKNQANKSPTSLSPTQAVPANGQHRVKSPSQQPPMNGRRADQQSRHHHHLSNPKSPSLSTSSSLLSSASSNGHHHQLHPIAPVAQTKQAQAANGDSLRYEYDDHYFLTDPDEFIYEFFPLAPEWQLIKTRPIALAEFEQLPFVRSLFFKYGLYFPQQDIRSVLYTDSSGATTIKIGMPTHMIPTLIFHYNLKYYDSDKEDYEGVNLKRFVMQSVESGSDGANGQVLLSNIVSFRVHLPENGAYILDIFANSTTPTQYVTGEPMKFKSVCKFKIIAKNLKTVMIPLPDCASGEYGPMKATRLFGIIPLTHESGLVSVTNDKRFLEIQFRMTRPLSDFMASLHKNGYDERQLSKAIKIFIDGDIVIIKIKFFEDGQYGLDVYTRDQMASSPQNNNSPGHKSKLNQPESQGDHKRHLLTHCCKYLINVRTQISHQ